MRQPLVLVPGIQGRLEYVQPTVDALSVDFDVITVPLCGERGCDVTDAASTLDVHVDVITRILDERRIESAVVCGISFGGLVALHMAATQRDRVSALVLASTPGPGWHLRKRHEFYARIPWLFGPVFLAESPFRLRPEVIAALPDARERRRYTAWQLRTLLKAPLSVKRMAMRARLIAGADMTGDAARVTAATLIITGESSLDQVVNAHATREYAALIRGAEAVVLERTGHLGSLTRPHQFARLIRDFVSRRARPRTEVRASA